MPYIDCFLAPVPRANKDAYEDLSRVSEQVLRECGAVRVTECWLDESGPEAATYHGESARVASQSYKTFRQAAGAQDGETVVVSFVEWPEKEARDRGMARVTSDPRMQFEGMSPAFDGRRLISGGFKPMLGGEGEA
jgi:uncharacterized protein YbaA (DUF1428 family)